MSNQLPRQRKNIGKRKLACIGVDYATNEKVVGESGAQRCADAVAKFYEKNSRGKLQIQSVGFPPVFIDDEGDRSAYQRGVKKALATHPGFNYYIIPGIYTGPHAGGKVAHVKSTQVNPTAVHEVGHLMGLGHSGRYERKKDKWVLNAYGDTDSVMGRIISSYLTAPQYYHLGWLEPDEYVLHDPNLPHYNLRRIGDFGGKGLATVIVPSVSGDGRPAFVSISREKGSTAVSLHLSTGGGSQKVAEFASEWYDERFTGLHIKVLGHGSGLTRVLIDRASKPTTFLATALMPAREGDEELETEPGCC